MRRPRPWTSASTAAALLAALTVGAAPASAAPPADAPATQGDVRLVGPDYNGGELRDVVAEPSPTGPAAAPAAGLEDGEYTEADLEQEAARTGVPAEDLVPETAESRGGAADGTASAGPRRPPGSTLQEFEPQTREFLALDDLNGLYTKDYVLRGVGENVEVWVAQDLAFLEDDCRNDGVRTVITDAQVAYFVDEFDRTIYPVESEAFSVPPSRDGSDPAPIFADGQTVYDVIGDDAARWEGDGERVVTLVDNVRDDNWYDLDNTEQNTYIAGFFYSVFNEAIDRNVMTLDAFDWLHRTGGTPPDEPSQDPCTNAPARPFLYEGVFAHEYQHLLEYYEDPDERTWVNEGLSDYAIEITGYVDAAVPVTEQGFDSRIQCFLGFLRQETPVNPLPRSECGPENSLTVWQDQGPREILADYGAAFAFMLYVEGRFGADALGQVHREDAGGFDGIQAVLDEVAPGTDVMDVFHDWTVAVLTDAYLDDGARVLPGQGRQSGEARFSIPSLDATVDLDNPEAYAGPGAPVNGSDYVRLRGFDGATVPGGDIRGITFDGADTVEPDPVEWVVDATPPGREGDGDPALYSGSGPGFDRAVAREVSVPASDATLTFETYADIEEGWDFGFVQVSTDGGETYTSLADELTTTQTDPGAVPAVQENVPGITGSTDGWVTASFDMSDYAGQDVVLAFRYVTDSGVDEPGWWVDDVTLGGEVLSDGSSLDGFSSATEISPVEVAGWTVHLVSIGLDGRLLGVTRVPLGPGSVAFLERGAVRRAAPLADEVVAVVTQDDRSETRSTPARYTLTVNGVLQPGG